MSDQSKKKTIEFFMIITNRTVYLAKYTVRSFYKIYALLNNNYDVILRIYLNCINLEKYHKYIKRWEKMPFVEIIYSKNKNTDFIWEGNGYILKTNGNKYTLPMERMSEPQDVAYLNSTANYFVTVDDDFEILDPHFVLEMLSILEKSPDLGVISTNKTITHDKYDHYSDGMIQAQERNDTWFCIYKGESKIQGESMELIDKFVEESGQEYIWSPLNGVDGWEEYYRKAANSKGKRYVWDGGAMLQSKIRESFPAKITAITDVETKYESQFIHYAGFAKNISVNTAFKTLIYRRMSIEAQNGCNILPEKLNNIYRKTVRKIFKLILNQMKSERLRPTPRSVLD